MFDKVNKEQEKLYKAMASTHFQTAETATDKFAKAYRSRFDEKFLIVIM